MSEKCWSMEEIAGKAARPHGDRDLDHAERCPRCRAVLLSYREFVEPSTRPAGSRPAEAGAALDAFLRREILAPGPPRDRAIPRGSWLRFWDRSPGGWPWGLRLATAAAAVLVVAAGLRGLIGGDDGAQTVRLRQVPQAESAAPSPFPAERLDDGTVLLSWSRAPEIESYEVVLLGRDLREVARLQAGSAAELRLAADRLRALDPAPPAFWRVVGVREGRPETRSRPVPFPEGP